MPSLGTQLFLVLRCLQVSLNPNPNPYPNPNPNPNQNPNPNPDPNQEADRLRLYNEEGQRLEDMELAAGSSTLHSFLVPHIKFKSFHPPPPPPHKAMKNMPTWQVMTEAIVEELPLCLNKKQVCLALPFLAMALVSSHQTMCWDLRL